MTLVKILHNEHWKANVNHRWFAILRPPPHGSSSAGWVPPSVIQSASPNQILTESGHPGPSSGRQCRPPLTDAWPARSQTCTPSINQISCYIQNTVTSERLFSAQHWFVVPTLETTRTSCGHMNCDSVRRTMSLLEQHTLGGCGWLCDIPQRVRILNIPQH